MYAMSTSSVYICIAQRFTVTYMHRDRILLKGSPSRTCTVIGYSRLLFMRLGHLTMYIAFTFYLHTKKLQISNLIIPFFLNIV